MSLHGGVWAGEMGKGDRSAPGIEPESGGGIRWLKVAQAKSPVVTGHSLRHTAATMAIDAGGAASRSQRVRETITSQNSSQDLGQIEGSYRI